MVLPSRCWLNSLKSIYVDGQSIANYLYGSLLKPQFFGHPLPSLPNHPCPKPFLWEHGAAHAAHSAHAARSARHVALPPQELRQELPRAWKAGVDPKNRGTNTKKWQVSHGITVSPQIRGIQANVDRDCTNFLYRIGLMLGTITITNENFIHDLDPLIQSFG